MLTQTPQETWSQFLAFIEEKSSETEFSNWFAPINVIGMELGKLVLEVPNIFVQEYLLDNYAHDLAAFLGSDPSGNILVSFVVVKKQTEVKIQEAPPASEPVEQSRSSFRLNPLYTFQDFIEGSTNQFVKSAAMGVAARPGKSYNPLFIHGGVGLGKTHLLHAIGAYVQDHHKRLKIHCITTEEFINDLVDNLKNKSIDRMKRFYRSLDILLVDDIQFLQNRLNFEEEFCNTFESLINQNKQIVITSDKPPSQLKLSERLIARMEWGLVAHIGMPDIETRVAILQHKAEKKGLRLPQNVAFFIAEHVFNNVRQLEGAVNRLNAHCHALQAEVTEDLVQNLLHELFQYAPHKKISVENILKSVATMFNVSISDLKSQARTKEVAFPRQVAMYLAKELMTDSLMKIASAFGGKTHSTLLHAWKKITGLVKDDDTLRRQIDMAKRNLEN